MSKRFRFERGFWVFLLRNLLLYFLLFSSYLYFQESLSLPFLSAGFILAVLLAFLLERLGLRLLPACLVALTAPLVLRLIFFLVFRVQIWISPGVSTDFFFFYFDRDFFPAVFPLVLVWLFNFLALRRQSFVTLEAGLNALLLLLVFWSQGGYRMTLYPHPSLYTAALLIFLLLEIFVLMLVRRQGLNETFRWKGELRRLIPFLWVLLPLLAVLLIFLLGHFNQGAVRIGGGLMKPTLFRFDFAQFVKLQSEIELSDDLVLLFRKEGPADRILLRRFVLSGFDQKKGFYQVRKKAFEPLPTTVPDIPEELPDPGYRGRVSVSQEFFFVNFDPSSLIGMNHPVRVAPLKNWDSSSFLRIYRVLTRVSNATSAELLDLELVGLTPEQFLYYTEYGDEAAIKELAERITSGVSGHYLKVLQIRDYLKHNFFYSLKPGLAADGDQLSHFLFQSKKGYCSYFAFAMALLCRSLKIPARVAVGFYVFPEAEVLNFYEVRAYQAHAWVEVFLGPYGWVEFDPTSEDIAPGEEFSLRFGFDIENLATLIEEILENQDRLVEQTDPAPELPRRALLWGAEVLKGLALAARLWYLTLPALYLLFLGLSKGWPLLATIFSRAPHTKVKLLFHCSLVRLRGLGLQQAPEESQAEYADRLDAGHNLALKPWTESYLKAVFAEEFATTDYKQAFRARQSFNRAYRRSFSLPLRALGILNPLAAMGMGRKG